MSNNLFVRPTGVGGLEQGATSGHVAQSPHNAAPMVMMYHPSSFGVPQTTYNAVNATQTGGITQPMFVVGGPMIAIPTPGATATNHSGDLNNIQLSHGVLNPMVAVAAPQMANRVGFNQPMLQAQFAPRPHQTMYSSAMMVPTRMMFPSVQQMPLSSASASTNSVMMMGGGPIQPQPLRPITTTSTALPTGPLQIPPGYAALMFPSSSASKTSATIPQPSAFRSVSPVRSASFATTALERATPPASSPKKLSPHKKQRRYLSKGCDEEDGHFTSGLGGENRLTIHFQSLGVKGKMPQTFGKSHYLVPDGICGTHRMYSQNWRFEIYHREASANPFDKNEERSVTVLEWAVANLASGTRTSVVETVQDAILREKKGNTICNSVLRAALESRIRELEKEILEGNKTPLQIANLRSLIKELSPKKCAQGLLFFGLRHEEVQLALGTISPTAATSSSSPSKAATVESTSSANKLEGTDHSNDKGHQGKMIGRRERSSSSPVSLSSEIEEKAIESEEQYTPSPVTLNNDVEEGLTE